MSREFDELQSRRRAQRSGTEPYDLPGFSRGTPPPYRTYPKDPAENTFRQRFAPFSSDPIGDFIEEQRLQGRGTPVRPGTQERFGDPTKVISENIPPQLGAPLARARAPVPETTGSSSMATSPGLRLPEGGQDLGTGAGALPPPSYLDLIQRLQEDRNRAQGIVPGRAEGGKVAANQPYTVGERGKETFVPEPETWNVDSPETWSVDKSKTERFLGNVTPQGPISGIISLMRTAGQAAQGQRPDLLTSPEGAIPEAVQGMVGATGPRFAGAMQVGKGRLAPYGAESYPTYRHIPQSGLPPPEPTLLLTSRLSPAEAAAVLRAEKVAAARQQATEMSQRLRDTGQMPPETSGPPIEMGGPVTPPPPESPLLPSQLVKEFGAVRKGVELKERLNPSSAQNLSAKEAAMQAAIRPHVKSIEAVTQRTQAPIAALEAALPSLSEAVSTPGKAASVANWVRVYERAARAKFTPQAKASLDLATRNLNNNLGTDLTLKDFSIGE